MAALKAGGKVHGEPKLRDPDSGYYSAAIIDSNGNSVEAVYRPAHSSARSAVSSSIDSTVSITTKSSSRASSRTQTTVPSRSEARSHTSRASTKVERPYPSEKSRDLREPRESRDSRDLRDSRDSREPRESRGTREPREPREPRDSRESREPRESRGSRESTASSNNRRGSSTAQAQAYAAQQREQQQRERQQRERQQRERQQREQQQREQQQREQQQREQQQREQQQQNDGSSRAAKTLVGSLIGAAAGAALAYAWSGNNPQSPASEDTSSQPTQPAQPTQSGQSAQQPPRERTYQQAPSSRSSSQTAQTLPIRTIEASGSYSPPKQPDPPRPGLTRSVTSKNPRASTIYEGSEYGGKSETSRTYLDDSGRRASDGGAAFGLPDIANLPLRAIEYPPPTYSKANEPSRAIDDDKRSMYSASTARPSNASYQYQYQDDRNRNRDSAYTLSHNNNNNNNKYKPNSTASRTPRNIPLPESIAPSYRPSNTSGSGTNTGSYTSARGAPLTEGSLASFHSNSTVPIPESVVNVDVDTDVTPDDSVSQISSNAHRSKAMPRQMPTPARSGVSASALSKRSSRFEEPVRPDDSISQVSCNSRSTARAGGGGGERRSQVV